MENQTNLYDQKAIDKVKELAQGIDMCLFCTHLRDGDGESTRPMSTQGVDEQGNIWFFSDKTSLKNAEIKKDPQVRLYYAKPTDSAFMVLNGEAEILYDRQKIEEYWSPHVKAWFDGKDDPNISLIKVNTKTAYYWDVEGNKMVNFFKFLASMATGAELIDAKEGNIKI